MPTAASPKLSGQWKYHTYEDQRLKVWSADTVADAVKLAGATVTPNVTFGDPVYVEDREGVHIYRVTMTISNIDEMFDAGQTRFYFSYHPTLVFSGETLTAATSDMPCVWITSSMPISAPACRTTPTTTECRTAMCA